MKRHILETSLLALALLACTVQVPGQNLNRPQAETPQSTQTPLAKAAAVSAHKTQVELEKLILNLHFPRLLQVQQANWDELVYIQAELVGEGLDEPYFQDGDEYIDVTEHLPTVSISNVPLEDGAVRLVTVRGYDANYQLLQSFETSAHYVSTEGVETVTLDVERNHLPLGWLLQAYLDSNSEAIAELDLSALQDRLLAAMNYQPQTREFDLDPVNFDATALFTLVDGLRPELPSVEALQTEALVTTQPVQLTLQTPGGGSLAEMVRLVINDPNSLPVDLPVGTSSGTEVSLGEIIPGTWTVRPMVWRDRLWPLQPWWWMKVGS